MSKKGPNTQPTQRQRQVSEEVRHILSSLLQQGLWQEEALQDCSITISEVRMSIDLKHAFAFVTPLGGQNTSEVVSALNRCAPQLRHQLGKSLRLRGVPALRFEHDQSFETANHIENLLRSPHVAQDL
ncbi:MAG: 30S ribosome-binding factor RbfA [Pseudomonadota bacterium]